MDFQDLEAVEGLRFSWNAWPTSRLEATRCAVPFGIVCQPVQHFPDLPELPYGPLRCASCGAVLNPFCPVNFDANTWFCCICLTGNTFPKSHSKISETNLPAELFPTHNVVEYCPPSPTPVSPPSVVFLVDVEASAEDARSVAEAVHQAAAGIPDGVRVGLVACGSMVSVHLLRRSPGMPPAALLLQGDQPCTADKVDALITSYMRMMDGSSATPSESPVKGVVDAPRSHAVAGAPPAFAAGAALDLLVPVEDCRDAFLAALQTLPGRAAPKRPLLRPKRVTGAAIAAAVALLEAGTPPGSPGRGRVVAILCGPCTSGPGLVVEREYSDLLRSHHDLHAGTTLHFRTATGYYTAVGERMGRRGLVLDVFACSPDQVGLAELRPAVEGTGGTMLLADLPASDVFAESLKKLFRKNEQGQLGSCFDATMEVRASEGVRVAGAVGPCTSLRRKDSPGQCKWTSDGLRIGQSGTWAWRMPCLTPSTSVAVLFEVANLSAADVAPESTLFVQVSTSFIDPSGVRKLRICTVGRRWKLLREVTPGLVSSGLLLGLESMESGERSQEEAAAALFDVITGFDQEAAAAIVAKMAVAKLETQSPRDVIRWLDRMLIRFGAKFGRYTPNIPPSFLLAPNLFLFPSFLYHLRRSPFLQVFNCSPDDSAFRRVALLREGVPASLLMVQPSLVAYTLSAPPQHMPLELTVVKPDNILLYDSFFELVVHHGSTIAQWKREGYHEQSAHANFKRLLDEPVQAAKQLARERWLEPRLIVCEQNDSFSRFLTCRLSPADVRLSGNIDDARMAYISTDDVSLQNFMSHFHDAAVRT